MAMIPIVVFPLKDPGKPELKLMLQDSSLGIRFCLKGEKEGLRLNLSPLTKSQKI